ncbi:MAG: PSD1 and planctomycete cytochrome C domain-containing protein [Bryobacteraceae bacterium]
MSRHVFAAGFLLLALPGPGLPQSQELPPPSTKQIEFARDVEPLFRKHCSACHGTAQQMNGLRLDGHDAVLRGGYSGKAVLPGDSAGSRLIHRVAGFKDVLPMPPSGTRLTAEEVGILRAWIDQGAKGSATPAATSEESKSKRSSHWSFQPIRRSQAPAVKNASWVRNPIDAFVLAKLESENLNPSPAASRGGLLRRVFLDLTGLPPTPQDVAAFLNDRQPDAYGRVVERLLASPHYGEKWARHWLDLARYADSDGYEKDLARPHAWRYRQWVINALNRDMPFVRFTVEQIAGDLLPGATVEQRVATGFHRNTLTNREAGVSRAEIRFEQLVDRTGTVGTVWLGLTVGCAQCHDHKYDPISQKDFYKMFAFFASADEENIDAPMPGELGPYLAARPEYDRKRRELLEEYGIAGFQADWEANIREALANPGKRLDWDFACTSMRAMLDNAEKLLHAEPAKRSREDAIRLTDYFIRSSGPKFAKDQELVAKFKELRAKLQAMDADFPALSQAQTMAENPQPPKNFLYVRGDYRNPGIEVEPGTPAFLPAALPQTNAQAGPARLALARWIASRDNPLTARVVVNRAWQELFGRGLVQTSEDFGTQGEKPSHPELLDWLASEFMDGGWSMKELHRLIVTSATYRQSSKARPELDSRDPDNALLARQSRLRLSAELVRDSALAAGGLLNTAIGGPSVKPAQPKGVSELTYANSGKWVESEGPDRYRRGLYTHFQRTAPHPQLMNFDAPDSHVACSRRRRSNTPLQALNLLNDSLFLQSAQGLAIRVLRTRGPNFADRLAHAFEIALARPPGARESERLLAYLEKQKSIFESDPAGAASVCPIEIEGVERRDAAAWVALSSVLLNLDEFITRE